MRFTSPQRLPRRFAKSGESGVGAMRQVRAQHAPAAFCQNLEIAARLRGLDDAETRLAVRDIATSGAPSAVI